MPPAPEKPEVRWLPPDADTLRAFDELRGFTVPGGDDDGPIEIVRPERLVRTIGFARNAVTRLLEDTDQAEVMKRAATAIFFTGCLLQIFHLVRTRKPSDA